MAAIFPPFDQGGKPPGVNIVNGFSPMHPVTGEGPFYVAPDCSTVLTDGQLNAITSEILAAVDELGFAYNSTRIDNLGQSLSARFQQAESGIDGKVDRSGDVMSGPLMLAGDPTNADEAATKAYVDTENADQTFQLEASIISKANEIVSALNDELAAKINRMGDSMVGPLLADEPTQMQQVATKHYVDSQISGSGHFVDVPTDNKVYGRSNASWQEVVSIIAQAFAAGQQAQARANLYAAPLDALAYNGIQINGNMDVSLEHGSTVVPVAGATSYVIDQWKVAAIGATVSAQQTANAPPGYTNSLYVSVATPMPAPGPNDQVVIYTPIEGSRWRKLAFGTTSAVALSIGFWIKAFRPGPYAGAVKNQLGTTIDRAYPFSFQIQASNVWEYKTVTIPGDTAGTWVSGAVQAATLSIQMAAGANLLAAEGAWLDGQYGAVSGMVNGAATTSDYMQLTGVMLLPGNEVPSAERAAFITRAADEESEWCRRYWNITHVINRILAGAVQADSDITGHFSRTFHAQPILTLTPGGRLNVYSAIVDAPALEGNFRHSMLAAGPGDSYCFNDIIVGDARF